MIEGLTKESRIPRDYSVVALSPQEMKLIRLINDIGHGRIEGELNRINVQAGLPVSAELMKPTGMAGVTATQQVRLDR